MKVRNRVYRNEDGPFVKVVVEVSDKEKERLKEIKFEIKDILNRYCEIERLELDNLTCTHIFDIPKVYDLLYIKRDIMVNLYYNKYYEDVVYFKNGFVEFTETNLFYQFASAYKLLDEYENHRGLDLLRNLIKVKLIDELIKIDYDNVYKVFYKIDNQDHFKKPDLFTIYGYDLFIFLAVNYNIKHKGVKFSNIYNFMYRGNDKAYSIHCVKEDFRIFVEELYSIKFSKVYSNHNSYDNDKKRLEKLKEEYIKANNLTSV